MLSFLLKSTAKQSQLTPASIIASGTVFVGDIDCQGDIRIDGIIKGNVRCSAKVVLGSDGVIEGNLFTQEADIMGRVDGKVYTNELLYMRPNATVNGDIQANQLMIDPSASFNGQCTMMGNAC